MAQIEDTSVFSKLNGDTNVKVPESYQQHYGEDAMLKSNGVRRQSCFVLFVISMGFDILPSSMTQLLIPLWRDWMISINLSDWASNFPQNFS